MSTAERTDPRLWEAVKEDITRSPKGGEPGEWSARKAQLAVKEYKKRGGGYRGRKRADNDLAAWTDEDWGTKSGKRSKETGERYMPKRARSALTDEEYRRTSRKKRADSAAGKQFSSQPPEIAQKTARFRGEGGAGPTKGELMDAARRLGVEGRSTMDKRQLNAAIGDKLDGGDRDAFSTRALRDVARIFEIGGRSRMSKAEIFRAVRAVAG